MTLQRNNHSTLSYALLMSNLIAHTPLLPLVFRFMWWNTLKATSALSVIWHFGTKALCCSMMRLESILLRQFAVVLEKILYRTLQRLCFFLTYLCNSCSIYSFPFPPTIVACIIHHELKKKKKFIVVSISSSTMRSPAHSTFTF